MRQLTGTVTLPVLAEFASGPVAGAAPEHRGPRALRELTAAIRAGDALAFAEFYERYSLRLYKYLLALSNGDEHAAREVMQTTVTKLAKSFGLFEDEPRLWRWLCRVARNAYIDFSRARRREERFVTLQEHAMELPETCAGEHKLAASLQHALELLSDEERELMRAAYVDGRPLQELAHASGQTYKAVESRLGRLRQKLKSHLLQHLRHETRS